MGFRLVWVDCFRRPKLENFCRGVRVRVGCGRGLGLGVG